MIDFVGSNNVKGTHQKKTPKKERKKETNKQTLVIKNILFPMLKN
jgi:hypothetical protein